jgi:hypothetical protein
VIEAAGVHGEEEKEKPRKKEKKTAQRSEIFWVRGFLFRVKGLGIG